jgi:hypothetical protein
MYTEEIRYLPKVISPPGFSIEKIRGRDNVECLGGVLVDLLNSFRLGLLVECPWLPSDPEGMECWGLLKKLLIRSTTVERRFFSE